MFILWYNPRSLFPRTSTNMFSSIDTDWGSEWQLNLRNVTKLTLHVLWHSSILVTIYLYYLTLFFNWVLFKKMRFYKKKKEVWITINDLVQWFFTRWTSFLNGLTQPSPPSPVLVCSSKILQKSQYVHSSFLWWIYTCSLHG